MKKDFVIVLLVIALLVSGMLHLMTFRVVGDKEAVNQKVQRELEIQAAKRAYFEWRESKSLGHSVGKQAYPEAEEFERITGSPLK